MKASVDKDACIGCELCTQTCPDVFRMEDGIAVVYNNSIPAESEKNAIKAADECPVSCITIE